MLHQQLIGHKVFVGGHWTQWTHCKGQGCHYACRCAAPSKHADGGQLAILQRHLQRPSGVSHIWFLAVNQWHCQKDLKTYRDYRTLHSRAILIGPWSLAVFSCITEWCNRVTAFVFEEESVLCSTFYHLGWFTLHCWCRETLCINIPPRGLSLQYFYMEYDLWPPLKAVQPRPRRNYILVV